MQEDQRLKTIVVRLVGVFLMSSVLSTLKEVLSSLLQWRTTVRGHRQYSDDTTMEYVPLEHILLPLACVAVFEANLSPTTDRYTVLSLFQCD